MNESSCWSKSSLAFGAVNSLGFLHSNRRVVVSHCCFNLHFPNYIRLGTFFFICLLAICISSLVRRPGFLSIFKLGCSFSYCWVFRGLFGFFFGVFWIKVFYWICLLQIFSPSLRLVLFSWQYLLHSTNFNFNEVQFINSLLHGLIWNSPKPCEADCTKPANLSRLNDFIIPDVILAE